MVKSWKGGMNQRRCWTYELHDLGAISCRLKRWHCPWVEVSEARRIAVHLMWHDVLQEIFQSPIRKRHITINVLHKWASTVFSKQQMEKLICVTAAFLSTVCIRCQSNIDRWRFVAWELPTASAILSSHTLQQHQLYSPLLNQLISMHTVRRWHQSWLKSKAYAIIQLSFSRILRNTAGA